MVDKVADGSCQRRYSVGRVPLPECILRESPPGPDLALLYPFFATPYVLLHDLLILVPVFLLLSADREVAGRLLYAAIFTYFGALVLLLLGQRLNVALFVLIPAGLLALYLKSFRTNIIGSGEDITIQ